MGRAWGTSGPDRAEPARYGPPPRQKSRSQRFECPTPTCERYCTSVLSPLFDSKCASQRHLRCAREELNLPSGAIERADVGQDSRRLRPDPHPSRERTIEPPPEPARLFQVGAVSVRVDTVEVLTAQVSDRWLRKLKDRQARLRIVERIDRLAHGNPGDKRPFGEGVCELRRTTSTTSTTRRPTSRPPWRSPRTTRPRFPAPSA